MSGPLHLPFLSIIRIPSWAWTMYSLFLCDVCCSFSHVQLFVTSKECSMPGFLSFTISWSLFELMSIELVMPPNQLIYAQMKQKPSVQFSSVQSLSGSQI